MSCELLKFNCKGHYNVESLRLFGSVMRTDWSQTSDIDVLCVSELNPTDLKRLKGNLEKEIGELVSISFYTPHRIRLMFEQGHLFAWHLYLESESLTGIESDFIDLLGRPGQYRDGTSDISSLMDILRDVHSSAEETRSLIFQGGVVYLCLRNIALCASWYSDDGLNFSKNSPFSLKFGEFMPGPMSYEMYEVLVNARHSSTRGEKVKTFDRSFLNEAIVKAISWSEVVLKNVGSKKNVE